jgi:uncharacterized Rossmann fold enzyme
VILGGPDLLLIAVLGDIADIVSVTTCLGSTIINLNGATTAFNLARIIYPVTATALQGRLEKVSTVSDEGVVFIILYHAVRSCL